MITFNNVLINNITGVTPHNFTYHKDYYDESGNYAFTGTYYDYQSADGDAGGGIYLKGYYSINMTNVNITNSCGGDISLIGAGYSAYNVYFNNILIENISSFYYESIKFDEKQQKYVTDASFSETRIFELSSGYNLTIYNMKVINIDRTTGESVAEIEGGNVIMENVIFINWDSEPGVGNLIYDPVTGEYLYEYLEYHDCEEFMDIMAEDGDVNMTNVVMGRIPAPYDSSYIGATRVNIVNSTFKNMYCTITYYRYNLTTHKYDLTDSTNEGVIFEIETEDYLRIVNSTVENISTSKYALGIDSNNVSFINTTFKDIHAELLDHDDYYHEYSDVTHGNSFKIKRNSNAVLILDSRFINCTADYGGALYIDGTVVYNITNTTFESNKAIQGGAIYINGSGVGSVIFNTTFIENLASNNGGAIYILETAEDNATLINQSTFIGNHPDHDGGAFFYNDTQAKFFFCDYEWFNRTAMFSDGKLNLNTKTGISDSLFENNTDYALNITVKDIDEFKNQTVIICIDVNATGEISVNVTDENGQFITDINGNFLKDKNFTLVNGKVVIELGNLPIGKYNVSAYYNNYNSQYDLYHDYAYHLNSTVFGVHKHIFNVDANDTIFVDENVTVTVELNNLSTGTVNITISNETDTFTFADVPIVNGTAKLSVGEFLAGKYNVSVTYAGDEMFSADSNQTSFEVIQRQSYVNVTVDDVEYKNNAVVIVKVPLDQKGNVTIKINNVEYTKEITNGQVEFVIENLTVQKWEVNVTFAENRVYKSVNNRTEFNVLPIDLNANVTAQNITVLDNPTFAIEVPEDFKGNVSITVDGKTYNGTVKDIVELEKVLAGNKTAVVEFYGDENYKKLTLEIPFEVERTASAVEVKVDDVTYPETAVALINVSGMANGTVEIKIGDKTFTGTVSNGVAKVNITGLNAGVKDVSVRFITNDDYNADGSNTTSFTVFKVESFVLISNDGDDIVVTLPQNATGEVVIYIDGKAYPVSVEDHKAILKDILKIGNNSVVAAYAGDNNYLDSINVTNLVLNKLKSSLNASAESVTYGEDVIVTVNVPSFQTGSVTITVDGKNYTSEIKDGKSEFTISDLSADDYEVKVYYSGDDVYEASQNVTSFTVNKKDLDAEVVALNITVEDNAKFFINIPDDFNGKVKITVDGENYDDVVKFMVEMGKLSEGNKTAKVTIYGDNNYNNETLDVKFTVSNVTSPEPAPAYHETNVTVVNVTSDSAVAVVEVADNANGTVNVTVDGKTYPAKVVNGTAVVPLDNLTPGNHSVVADFEGDDGSKSSAATSVDIPKENAPVNVTVDTDGDKVTVKVDVPDDATGVVLVDVDGVGYYANITNGSAILEIDGVEPGNHTAKVTYPGDDKYGKTSTSVDFNVTESKKPIATVLVVDSTFTRYATDYYAGERGAMFYGTLMDTDGNVLANKTVQIAVNGPIYNVTTDKDGKAGLMVNLMNANIYTYALFFSGDETYNASHIASSKLTVVKKTTSIKASNKAFAKSTKTKVVEATLKTMKNPFNGKTYLKTGKKVTLKVNGKTYKVKINSKGIAKFKVKLTKKGKYTAKISFAGDRTYEAASKNIVITIK